MMSTYLNNEHLICNNVYFGEGSETILSSVSHSQDYSSSDSDDLFSTQKQADISVRSKSKFKTNKIHDLNVQLETRETKNENVNDRVRSEHPPSRFLLDVPKKSDRRSSVGGSSIDTEFKKSITSASEISYKDRIRDRFNKVKVMCHRSRPKINRMSMIVHLRKNFVMTGKGGGIAVEYSLQASSWFPKTWATKKGGLIEAGGIRTDCRYETSRRNQNAMAKSLQSVHRGEQKHSINVSTACLASCLPCF